MVKETKTLIEFLENINKNKRRKSFINELMGNLEKSISAKEISYDRNTSKDSDSWIDGAALVRKEKSETTHDYKIKLGSYYKIEAQEVRTSGHTSRSVKDNWAANHSWYDAPSSYSYFKIIKELESGKEKEIFYSGDEEFIEILHKKIRR